VDRQSLESLLDELEKAGQFGGDIDDLYAAPSSSIMPTLRRAHKLGKSSSWMDIGPVGQREGRPAQYPKLPWAREKKAAGLGDLYRSAYVGATQLAHSPAAYAVAKGLTSGTMKGNPLRAAGGIAEGVAKSEAGSKVLQALRRKAKEGVKTTRELLYPSPGRVVYASVKTAEPPPPPGITAEQWDKILQRKSKSREMAKTAYKLQGHTDFQGLRIAIENRKGSVRKGKDRVGHEWRTKMSYPYGYIVGTRAKDDEPVDVYVGPDKEAPDAYVVHQHKPDGTGFDEDKVMLGFQSKKEAKEAYLKHYDDPKFLGPMSRVAVDRLRELVKSKRKLVKISAAKKDESSKVTRFLRKAGPGVGGALGAGIGALSGARRGRLLRGALKGLGTGATLGWIPGMAHGVTEGVKELR
jgi:hypothetical protein